MPTKLRYGAIDSAGKIRYAGCVLDTEDLAFSDAEQFMKRIQIAGLPICVAEMGIIRKYNPTVVGGNSANLRGTTIIEDINSGGRWPITVLGIANEYITQQAGGLDRVQKMLSQSIINQFATLLGMDADDLIIRSSQVIERGQK